MGEGKGVAPEGHDRGAMEGGHGALPEGDGATASDYTFAWLEG